ncbi:MAG: DUF3990 domain-containing protein [Clostridiales bacterium]|nr:DUF3990 domain-containing protein [Clostridiales bacterium]
MIVYHGSSQIVKTPAYGLGSETNDYGRGFYCTENQELAGEWACPTVKDGFSNKYHLDLSDLKVLYLNKDGYHILNWIAILLEHRIFPKRSPIARQASQYVTAEFLPDISGFDVIVGYRADDSYFSYAKDFLNNTISVNQLSQAMKLGELGEQIVLMSEKPFGKIQYLEHEIAGGSIYYPRRMEREERARRAYLDNHGQDFASAQNDLFVLDITREQVKNDDPRLR